LAGCGFGNAYGLLEAGQSVLEGMDKVTLQAVFLEWMDRLRKCMPTNGGFTDYATTTTVEDYLFVSTMARCSYPRGIPCI
jgi:hypothetical protein